jgi:Cu/Ag efflux protein CusF
MKYFIGIALLSVTLASVQIAGAQTVAESKPVTVTATIEAIDKADRTVTLKRANGVTEILEMEPEMQGFDRLRVGDRVTATFFETLAVRVRQPGDPPPTAGPTTSTVRKDRKPGSTTISTETVIATVEAIDPKTPSLTVKGAKGSLTFKVTEPKTLQGLKVGDSVDLTVTRGRLVKVEPPAK